MNRILAMTLAVCCLCALGTTAQAQALKERSLTDAPAATASRPVQATPQAQPTTGQQATAYQPPAAAQPAPQTHPAPPPAGTPVNGQPVGSPPYQSQPAGSAPYQSQPAPAPGGTPINGQQAGTAQAPPPPPPPLSPEKTYKREEINREVMGFFEGGSRGLAQLVARAFRDLGEPVGFIKGNEAGGALIVGLRYGAGSLFLKGYPPVPVFWQSPSLGIDLGVNAVKVFTLVYGMNNPEQVFQRFPGVDGSAYLIGGFGMNYQRSGPVTLAPIRFGVGLRLGANVGYQVYTRNQTINPF